MIVTHCTKDVLLQNNLRDCSSAMCRLGRSRGTSLIKIRYQDLPSGLHVRTEARGRSTVICLLPGLTHAERRAALLRARRSAGLGYGPRLTATGVAAAAARDRLAATARNGVTAFRAHPLLLLPPVVIVTGATLVYVMLSAVTITFPPGGLGGRAIPGRPGGPAPGGSGRVGYQVRTDRPAPGGPGTGSGPPGRRAPGPPPARLVSASPAPTASSPAGPPFPSPTPTTAPTASPSPSPPGGSGSPAPSPTATCIDLGPLGLCLK
jgi:hypothetical protein